MLGPHLKLGAGSPEFCLRIYWYVDTTEANVGHIGAHLPDAGSSSIPPPSDAHLSVRSRQ